MRSTDRLPKVGRFYSLGKGTYNFHVLPDSFLSKLGNTPFFLLKVRENELARNVNAYYVDFIVGEQVYENVLITCANELNLDPVQEDEESGSNDLTPSK